MLFFKDLIKIVRLCLVAVSMKGLRIINRFCPINTNTERVCMFNLNHSVSSFYHSNLFKRGESQHVPLHALIARIDKIELVSLGLIHINPIFPKLTKDREGFGDIF